MTLTTGNGNTGNNNGENNGRLNTGSSNGNENGKADDTTAPNVKRKFDFANNHLALAS